jgi:hypothetical protein
MRAAHARSLVHDRASTTCKTVATDTGDRWASTYPLVSSFLSLSNQMLAAERTCASLASSPYTNDLNRSYGEDPATAVRLTGGANA